MMFPTVAGAERPGRWGWSCSSRVWPTTRDPTQNSCAVGSENTEGRGPCWEHSGTEDEKTLVFTLSHPQFSPEPSMNRATGSCQQVAGEVVGGVLCRAGREKGAVAERLCSQDERVVHRTLLRLFLCGCCTLDRYESCTLPRASPQPSSLFLAICPSPRGHGHWCHFFTWKT